MKLSSAKKYVKGYKASAARRGAAVDHRTLHKALRRFQAALDHNGLTSKY